MNPTDCFLDAKDPQASDALLLTVLANGESRAWLDTRSEAERGFLARQGFDGKPGTFALLPDGAAMVASIEDAADPHAVAVLPLSLPEGDYRLSTDGHLATDVACLGWGLGSYRFERYRSAERSAARLVIDPAAHADTLALIAASHQVRDLINTPSQDMGPADLEAAIRTLAETHGGELQVFSGDDLLANNFPAIHAVGRASHRAPRLIELTWGDPNHPRLALIGKGVCFDTGGLDLKPSSGMRNMKKDMGGAAHAIGLARLVIECQLPVRLQLLVPAVENAVGPDAYRPGEVIATRAGLSVEIDNTDAEGRIVLCDALTYASESNPALMIDFATLTGAARIALGPDLPALFCNDDGLAEAYLAAGERTRDPLWHLPLWRPYRRYLKSGIARLANSGSSRMAGSITAALYLQHFVPDQLPWAHVDVYSWCDGDRPGHPSGGEAQGLRAALALLRERLGN
ncbi:MAG: leucyl aminopeptidase family protein [Xanthomonadaceae bacterium]|nr:leucyl aminopeptidase family protein [Xanthomonadaceae bacterium]